MFHKFFSPFLQNDMMQQAYGRNVDPTRGPGFGHPSRGLPMRHSSATNRLSQDGMEHRLPVFMHLADDNPPHG